MERTVPQGPGDRRILGVDAATAAVILWRLVEVVAELLLLAVTRGSRGVLARPSSPQ
jgi:hypothetical protein